MSTATGFLGFENMVNGDIRLAVSSWRFDLIKSILCVYLTHGLSLNHDTYKKQGQVNCLKKTLEICKAGNIPLWLNNYTFNQTAQVSKLIDAIYKLGWFPANKQVVQLNYDDYLMRQVNHSTKEMRLLEMFFEKISPLGRTEHYVPTIEDYIYCDIPVEPSDNTWISKEGLDVLTALETKGLIKQYRKFVPSATGGGGCIFLRIGPAIAAEEDHPRSVSDDELNYA